MAGDEREWDIVVYGATGDAGGAIASYVAKNFKGKWAIAGRSKEKLDRLRSEILAAAGADDNASSSDVGVVVASSSDGASMDRMAKSARIIISSVGPYSVVGEPTIKACVENGTNYVDVTGEVDFVLAMREKYGKRAKETGATLCSFAGYDCVPSEVCVLTALKALGDPPKLSKAEMVVSLDGGNAPRGTIRTTITKLPNFIWFVRDLIAYVPSGERANAAASLFLWLLPRWSSSCGAFTIPHAMGWCNVPVVHRSFAGKVGRFHDRLLLPKSVGRWWTGYGLVQTWVNYSVLALCAPAIATVFALSWLKPSFADFLLNKFDSLEYRGSDGAGGIAGAATVDCRLHATAPGADGKEKEATVRLFCEGDAGIICTALLASETAFAMIECEKKGTLPKGTFGSPATLVGDRLAERLRGGMAPGCTLGVLDAGKED